MGTASPAHSPMSVMSDLPSFFDSHYMIALGTVLQIASMFMLSLARQHQYYEVGFILRNFQSSGSILCCSGVPGAGSRNGTWPVSLVSSVYYSHRTPL